MVKNFLLHLTKAIKKILFIVLLLFEKFTKTLITEELPSKGTVMRRDKFRELEMCIKCTGLDWTG